ncbi:MAG: FeoB small GTPase domain-containing protein, partial [Bacteroidota bacterium]
MDSKTVKRLPNKIAIVGTPNCGKTSLFNSLTGLNQRVGNFSGVTVERKSATISHKDRELILIDLPGTNSLYPASEDEIITCQVLQDPNHPDHPDQVLVIADATQLRRGLALCSQVIDLGFPTLLVINRIDLLEEASEKVDFQRLSAKIGIPILPISVTTKKGLNGLKRMLFQDLPKPGRQVMKLPSGFGPALKKVQEYLPGDEPSYLSFQILLSPEHFSWIDSQKIGEIQELAGIRSETGQLISNELLTRYDFADEVLKEVMYPADDIQKNISSRIDTILTHRIWGYLVFFAVLILIFQSIFSWASYPSDAIDAWVEGIKSSLDDRLSAGWGKD